MYLYLYRGVCVCVYYVSKFGAIGFPYCPGQRVQAGRRQPTLPPRRRATQRGGEGVDGVDVRRLRLVALRVVLVIRRGVGTRALPGDGNTVPGRAGVRLPHPPTISIHRPTAPEENFGINTNGSTKRGRGFEDLHSAIHSGRCHMTRQWQPPRENV